MSHAPSLVPAARDAGQGGPAAISLDQSSVAPGSDVRCRRRFFTRGGVSLQVLVGCEAPVQRAGVHEFVVAPLRGDSPRIENDDAIGCLHR